MKTYTCHLFDVDGTLIDSNPVVIAALRSSLAAGGIDVPDESKLRNLAIGSPLAALKTFGIDNLNSYWRFYEAEVHRAQLFFADTLDILQTMKEKGCTIGVVSSLKNQQLNMLLSRFGLLDVLNVVVGWNDCTLRKPNPHPIRLALSRVGAQPERATYTGDTYSDMAAAKKAGVLAVYASWGGNNKSHGGNVTCIQELRQVLKL